MNICSINMKKLFKFICPRRQFMLTSGSNGMTLNALSDHSLPRFHFRLEACWTKASTLWQWCCSWQEPPTYQLEDLQRKIKLFWTLNFIVLTKKLKKLIPLSVFTNSKKSNLVALNILQRISCSYCFSYFKNTFTCAVLDFASDFEQNMY